MPKYHVEFDYGGVSELTSNVIADSMYAAYDNSGHEYLIMDSIVDYRRSDQAIPVDNQKLVYIGWSLIG